MSMYKTLLVQMLVNGV